MPPPDDENRDLAERIVQQHDEDPAFRALVAAAAPRLHAMVVADQARRLLPLGLLTLAVGGALAGFASGIARWIGLLGAVVGTTVALEALRRARKAKG